MATSVAAFDFYDYWEPPLAGAASSVAVADDAKGVPVNAAALAAGHGLNAFFAAGGEVGTASDVHAYADTILGGVGYDWRATRPGVAPRVRASRFTWTYGGAITRTFGLGAGVNRFSASKPYLTAAWSMDFGSQFRPSRYLSLGFAARDLNEPRFLRRVRTRKYVAGVAVRPGWERLTLACDAGVAEGVWDDVGWRAGAEVEFVDGVAVAFGYDDAKTVTVGCNLYFGHAGVGYCGALDESGRFASHNVNVALSAESRPSLLAGRDKFVEVSIYGPLAERRGGFSFFGRPRSVREVIRQLEAARTDRAVKGVLLRCAGVGFGGLAQELRNEIKKLRTSGKKVLVHLDDVSGAGDYYIASAADAICLSPQAFFHSVGIYKEVKRYTGFAALFGVEAEYVTAGEYKGTTSQLLGPPPTPEQLAEMQALVDASYEILIADLARGRGLTPEAMRSYCEGPPLSADECVAAGLADYVAYYDEFKRKIAAEHGKKELHLVAPTRRKRESSWGRGRHVQVILVEGVIVGGEGGTLFPFGPRAAGADAIVREIEAARRDDDCAAVVVRLNSGGGEAGASGAIYDALRRCREDGKVVVASMGGIAASGAYEIACGADYIFAQPVTVTGSVGVFTQKLVLEGLYKKYGIGDYVVRSHEHADAMSGSRRWTEEERRWVEDAVRKTYDNFVAAVAAGRKMKKEDVLPLAEGRVYVGARARELGLVDDLGGLAEAVAYARARAGLPDDAPVTYVGWEEPLADRLLRAAAVLAGWE